MEIKKKENNYNAKKLKRLDHINMEERRVIMRIYKKIINFVLAQPENK